MTRYFVAYAIASIALTLAICSVIYGEVSEADRLERVNDEYYTNRH